MDGGLTLGELAFYGWQYLHHVAAFPTYLTALHARLAEGAIRRAVLRNAADEEVNGVSHAELWRQFIGGMEAVQRPESEEMLPEIRQLVETYRTMASGASLPRVLGAFYAYESEVPRIAETKLAGPKQFYGAGDSVCEYFTITCDCRRPPRQCLVGSSSIAASRKSLLVPQMSSKVSAVEPKLCGVRSMALKPRAMVLFQ